MNLLTCYSQRKMMWTQWEKNKPNQWCDFFVTEKERILKLEEGNNGFFGKVKLNIWIFLNKKLLNYYEKVKL